MVLQLRNDSAGVDLSDLVRRGDAVLLAWAPGYGVAKPINQFRRGAVSAIRCCAWQFRCSPNLHAMSNVPPVPAVQTIGLSRSYGTMLALDSLDLTIIAATSLIHWLERRGKTTTLRILATFLTPSAGQARVLGHDVVQDADAVRHIIGYMPDFLASTKTWRSRSISIFSGPVTKSFFSAEKTVNDVLELVGLSEKRAR